MCKHLSQCIQKFESFPLRKKKPRWIFMRKHHILPGQMNSSMFHNRIHKENSDKSVLGLSHAVLLWCANAIFLLKVLLQNFCSFSRIFSTFAVEFLFLLLLYEVSINRQICFLFFITVLLPLTVLCLFLACSGITAPHCSPSRTLIICGTWVFPACCTGFLFPMAVCSAHLFHALSFCHMSALCPSQRPRD